MEALVLVKVMPALTLVNAALSASALPAVIAIAVPALTVPAASQLILFPAASVTCPEAVIATTGDVGGRAESDVAGGGNVGGVRSP